MDNSISSSHALMPPLVIPLFIPHAGCPHRCVYCEQRSVTGVQDGGLSPAGAGEMIAQWLIRPRRDSRREIQVAFYGGSFTGLDRSRQEELLAAVQPFLQRGEVDCIRLSTRPDYVAADTGEFLYRRGVRIVELGVQSLDEQVLAASGRGHDAAVVPRAVDGLRAAGLQVGIQLMAGLPGDSTVSFLRTIRGTAGLRPGFVRLYPAVVLRGSGLAAMYQAGSYRPLSLGKAVALCHRARRILGRAGVPVVRMGLQPSTELAARVLAGPYHPAFGELVYSRLLFRQARSLLAATPAGRIVRLRIAPADESAFRGPGKANLRRLESLGLLGRMELTPDPDVPRGRVMRIGA